MTLPLFNEQPKEQADFRRPLADRLRPANWEQFAGLEDLEAGLVEQLKTGQGTPPSLILWGPPGCGKTTLARLIGESFSAEFVQFSAVLGGVKDVRAIIAQAKTHQRRTILFVDEIHRFNKGQQDAFLPHVEDGTIVLIGATTENPSFYLNSALLSRARVLVLPALAQASLLKVLRHAAQLLEIELLPPTETLLLNFVGGDARRMLNAIESFVEVRSGTTEPVAAEELGKFLGDRSTAFYDRDGEEHYNMASAFIKSMRGSDPDAALYWGLRMLQSGEDPRFIIRRMIICASEDVGNADPRALQLATSTLQAFDALGLPEGRIPIAQCITYLACAPKSNCSYMAMKAALQAIEQHPKVGVPLHLRNAPTKLMKDRGYGAGYQYPHDFTPGAVDAQYLPDELAEQTFYRMQDSGYEKVMRERLEFYRGKL